MKRDTKNSDYLGMEKFEGMNDNALPEWMQTFRETEEATENKISELFHFFTDYCIGCHGSYHEMIKLLEGPTTLLTDLNILGSSHDLHRYVFSQIIPCSAFIKTNKRFMNNEIVTEKYLCISINSYEDELEDDSPKEFNSNPANYDIIDKRMDYKKVKIISKHDNKIVDWYTRFSMYNMNQKNAIIRTIDYSLYEFIHRISDSYKACQGNEKAIIESLIQKYHQRSVNIECSESTLRCARFSIDRQNGLYKITDAETRYKNNVLCELIGITNENSLIDFINRYGFILPLD